MSSKATARTFRTTARRPWRLLLAIALVPVALALTAGSASARATETQLDLFGPIGCAPSGFCLATVTATSSPNTIAAYDGATWSLLDLPANAGSPQNVKITCVGSGTPFCAVVGLAKFGSGGSATTESELDTYDGTSWIVDVLGSGGDRTGEGDAFSSVGCSNPTFCLAIAVQDAPNAPSLYTFVGSSWTGPVVAARQNLHVTGATPGQSNPTTGTNGTVTSGTVDSVSCPPDPTNWCLLTDFAGPDLIDVNGVIGAPGIGPALPGSPPLYFSNAKAGCGAVNSCFEIAPANPRLTPATPFAKEIPAISSFDGTAWGVTVNATDLPVEGYYGESGGLSCQGSGSAATCEAVDPYGATDGSWASVIRWVNGAWLPAIAAQHFPAKNAACWSTTGCVIDGGPSPLAVSFFNGHRWTDAAVPVIRSGASTGTAAGTVTGVTATAAPTATVVASVSGAIALLHLTCAAKQCKGSLSITEKVRSSATKSTTVVLGTASYALGRTTSGAARVHLNAAGKRALAKATAAHPIRATVTFTTNHKHSTTVISVR